MQPQPIRAAQTQPTPRPGPLTEPEMRQHLALGRSILISPVIAKDDDGNLVLAKAGNHIVHPSQVAAATTDLSDPAQREKARATAREAADRAVNRLAEIDRMEAVEKPADKTPPVDPKAPPKGK